MHCNALTCDRVQSANANTEEIQIQIQTQIQIGQSYAAAASEIKCTANALTHDRVQTQSETCIGL